MKNNNYPTWLVPIEIAKELKEIGFNEPCLYYNSEAISGMGYQCIEIEERIHNEDPNVIELREKEMRKERWRQMVEEIPIEEITLSTGEKIRGKFLEKDEYFEEVESENRYYKTFIVKVENI